MAEAHRWIDLIDPKAEDLEAHLADRLHPAALGLLTAPLVHDDEPRPRIETHGDYIVGVLLVAVAVPADDRIYYQEVDFILTAEKFLTVSKTPPGEQPFDPAPAKEACRSHEDTGMYVYHLVDEVAEGFLDVVDAIDDEIDGLEDLVESERPQELGRRIRGIRHDLLGIRRTLGPTRDAVRKIVDDRVELDEGELFPRDAEIAFGNAFDKLLRASEGLDAARDSLAGIRDYLQGKISNDQNEVMKRLTMIASLLLLPTFIVGLYGQNFHHIPELGWGFGYWWAWGWIVGTTIAQLVFFRWKRWF